MGAGECARCHRAEAEAYARTAMAAALLPVSEVPVLRTRQNLHTSWQGYGYRIVPTAKGFEFEVSKENDRLHAKILFAVGNASAGQTYILESGGKWYESRISYYAKIQGLDLTLGFAGDRPRTLARALGKEMTADDRASCLGCHTSAPPGTVPTSGISCETCHGDGSAHAESMARGRRHIPMRDLSRLTTEEELNLCGQCHRTWETVVSQSLKGMNTIRFQPYRLTNSKCYNGKDRRIACTACHNPHQSLVHEARAYDVKCSACHSHAANRICPVSQGNCVSCHMPKVELPGSHYRFTDHQIRIARADSRLPD